MRKARARLSSTIRNKEGKNENFKSNNSNAWCSRFRQNDRILENNMPRNEFSEYGNSPFEKLIGHNKAILDKWIELENVIFSESTLSSELLEQVRRTLAFGNECEYCMVKGRKPNIDKEDKKKSVAKAFAEMFVLDHKSISDGHFDMLKEEFNEREISELCSFISFITANQKLGRIYNLTEDYQKDKVTTMSELT